MKLSKKGFTLIELTVVMAIMAVLALVVIGAIQAANRSKIRTQNIGNARNIQTALEAYASRNGGRYCGGGGTVLCGNAQNLDTVYTALRNDGILNAPINTTCTLAGWVGGGQVDVAANTFTIRVADWNCNAAMPAQQITQ